MKKKIFLMPCPFKLSTFLLMLLLFHAGNSFAQSPGGVTTSLTGWFKSTSTAGTAASNPLMLNSLANNQVASWMSVGGTTSGSYAITQALASRMPVYQTGTTSTANFNFNPFIQFSNANNTLLSNISSSVDLLGSQGSVFIVVNTYTNTIPKNTALTYLFSTSRWQFKPGFRTQTGDGVAGSTGDYYNTAPYPAGVGTTSYPETSGIILLGKGVDTGTASNNFSAKRNGGTAGITNTYDNVYNPAVVTGFYLGSNNGGEVFNGAVAEVITYNTNLSDADVNKVESYLAVKYGVTLTTGQSLTNANYTAPDGSAFWNADNVYKYNVTGIGREDTSGLYQKQSKSVHNNALVTVYNKDTGTTFPVTNAANTTTVDASTSYFMTADNGLDNTVVAGDCVNRIARVWKVQKTGGIADVTIAAAKSELPLDIQYLVVSSSPAFPAGDITTYELEDTGTIVYKNVNIPTGYYFTYGSDHVVSASPIAIGCEITTTTLTATGLGSWTADAGNPAASVIASPASNSTAVSGFSLPGVYNFNWGSPECFETVAITFSGATPLPPVTIPITYCQGQTAQQPTVSFDTGNTVSWFYGGVWHIDPPIIDTSTVGVTTYDVKQITPGGCQSLPASLSITINPLSPTITSFTLPSAVCADAPNVVPTPATNFTTGGVYSAGAGLAIDPVTGEIDLAASIPGSYTVIYSIAANPASCLQAGSSTAPITINVAPVLVAATAIELCDNDYDGHATFNLNPAGTQVLNGQTGYTVTYHETLAEAEVGAGAITAPGAYLSETANIQTIFIRVVQSGTTTNCYSIETVELIVHPRPALPVMTDYVLCDEDLAADGSTIFNLITKNTEAAGADATLAVTYYNSQNAAQAGTPEIISPQAYTNTSNPQTVWVRIENTFGCFSVASFNLVVNPLPVVNTAMEPFYACEETPGQGIFNLDLIAPVVTNGAAGYIVAYYATLQQAQTGGVGLSTPYSSPTATIYVKVINEITGCASITTADLEVLPAPIAPVVPALEECDANNDQVAVFNINTALDYILSYMGGSVTLTVHETLADATFGANPLSDAQIDAYTNVFAFTTNGVQTLYINVSSNQTECFDIAELQLIVHPTPVAVTPAEPYQLCDNGASDTDGQAVFDLTTYAEEVLGANSPALYSVSYFTSFDAAVSGSGPIPNPANHTSASGTVYIKVTNNATGCYDIVELELIVNPLPVVNNPTPFTVCDDNDPDNENEEFDLTTKIDEITNGVLGLNVTFHTSYADAQGNTNAIPNPDAYTNTAAVETIFVRVTNAITGCYRIVLLDVRVEPLPEVLDPTEEDLTVCDTNGMGVGTFNLLELVDGLINGGGANLSIHFYETVSDAENGLNEIPNPASYQNPTPFLQPIILVIENATTGCQSNPYTFFLVVEPAPQAPALEDITDCDDYDNNDQDGKARVDLTVQNQVIYDALNIAAGDQDSIIIHYFTSEEDADADINMITNATQYTATSGQVIWVRVEDAETGCYSLTSFQVILNKPVDLIQPTPLVLCEDGTTNDGKTIFDLTVKNTEILGPMGIGMGNVVTYYTTQADALAGTSPIPTPEAYTNTSNAQTLFVGVTTPAGCKSYITLTIRVLPLPVPNMNPTALEKCDDISADGTETFNLTDAAAQILANDTLSQLSYWPTEEDANNGTNEILTPTAWPSATGSVWVKVSAHTTNATDPVCYVLVELNLIVNPLPATGTIAPYAICQLVYTGTATFDFNTHIDEILGAGVAPEDYDDYTLTFYFDAAAQAAGTPLPYIYDNVSTPQTILVEVVNTVTGCTNTASFVIAVEQQAIANPVTQATLDTYFDICDTDGSNDGFTEFDLTQATADIIGTQSPAANYTVTYYETQADALAGTNAIPTPAAYTNTTQNEQTIVAAISDITTVSGCISYTTFSVKAEILAEPVISTDGDNHTICVDFKTGQTVRGLILNSGITTAGNTYKWFLDGVEVTLDPSASTYEAVEPGNYTVEVTGPAPNFCVSGVSAAFNVIQSGPAVKIGEGYVVSNAFNENQTITVLVEGYGEYQYSLYPEGPWQNSNVFTNVPMGEQTIYVRDVKTANSCDIFEIPAVSIIDYPHFFTPNGDGYHDTWNIVGLKNYPEARIFIFDRYGKLLKQLSPESDVTEGEGWDGTYNGQPVPSDDYWFTVTYPDGNVTKEFKAHFSLKR